MTTNIISLKFKMFKIFVSFNLKSVNLVGKILILIKLNFNIINL